MLVFVSGVGTGECCIFGFSSFGLTWWTSCADAIDGGINAHLWWESRLVIGWEIKAAKYIWAGGIHWRTERFCSILFCSFVLGFSSFWRKVVLISFSTFLFVGEGETWWRWPAFENIESWPAFAWSPASQPEPPVPIKVFCSDLVTDTIYQAFIPDETSQSVFLAFSRYSTDSWIVKPLKLNHCRAQIIKKGK